MMGALALHPWRAISPVSEPILPRGTGGVPRRIGPLRPLTADEAADLEARYGRFLDTIDGPGFCAACGRSTWLGSDALLCGLCTREVPIAAADDAA